MRRTIILFAALLFSVATDAQPGRVMQNVYARKTTSLNGEWQTIVDPLGFGNFAKNKKPKAKNEHVEYDFSDSETLRVPGDWNTQRPELMFYTGTIWYKRDFTCHYQLGKRQYLYFGASNYETDVFVNGEKVGEHVGGYTPFCLDITDKVHDGDNFVTVRVNATRRKEGVPTVNSDWWNYGGLTRDVMLVETPDVSVDDYEVRLADGMYNRIEGWARLNQPVAGRKIEITIPQLKLHQVLTTDSTGLARFTAKANPQLWTPDEPRLYDVTISYGGERLTDHVGFRHIATEGRQILLNGKPVFLRGINIHEEAPYRTGRCTTIEDDSTLLTWCKNLGCNFVRLAHYPHNEQMVRLCDRMGLMVWSEIPVYWAIQWENEATLRNASQQLRENMRRDHNRCAVVMWSIANETPEGAMRNAFLSKLAEQVRADDHERLLTMALLHRGSKADTTYVHDGMIDKVDVVAFNNYLGWYGGTISDCDRRVYKIQGEKPVIVSEFGGGAKAGLHGDADTKWTEEYQAELYRRSLAMYDRVDGLAGLCPWILMDFRSAKRQLHGIQDFFNRKGLVSEKGEKKAAFYVLKDYYQTKR